MGYVCANCPENHLAGDGEGCEADKATVEKSSATVATLSERLRLECLRGGESGCACLTCAAATVLARAERLATGRYGIGRSMLAKHILEGGDELP